MASSVFGSPTSAYPELRKQYPQYDDMSDNDIALGFQQKYYPDLKIEEVHRALTRNYGAPELEPVDVQAKKPNILESTGAFTLNNLVKPLVEDLTSGPKELAGYFNTALDPNSTGEEAIASQSRAAKGMLRTSAALASGEAGSLSGALLKQMGKGALLQSITSGGTVGTVYSALTEDPHAPDYWDNLLTSGTLGAILGGTAAGVAKGLKRIIKLAGKEPVRVVAPTPPEMKHPLPEMNPAPAQERKPLWERMLETESQPVAVPKPVSFTMPESEAASAAKAREAFIAQRKAQKGK